MPSFSRVVTIATSLAVVSATAYALYFDHKRRNDPEFRKSLSKQNKRYNKLIKKEEELEKQEKLERVGEILTAEMIKDPLPSNPEQRELSFATNVELGEKLSLQAGKELEAACKFYKALSVYPNPADLLSIYQKTISEEIYEYIVMMIAILPPSSLSSFLGGSSAASAAAAATAEATIHEIDE